MFLPHKLYELLPYGYVAGGGALALASWAWPQAAWADPALVVGAAGVLFGLVLLMRRRTYRSDAKRYDARSLDDV
jgi:hypothetical protein